MKLTLLSFISFLVLFNGSIQGQDEAQIRLDNLKYYLTNIKDNIQSMKYYTDSLKILSLLDQMSEVADNIDTELNMIVIPSADIIIETPVDATLSGEPEKVENLEDYTGLPGQSETEGKDTEDTNRGIAKFVPFKNKFNTNLQIQFGINALHTGKLSPTGVQSPEINTGGSWYWDFALTRRARLGGKTSKVAINYGISFLKNRFKIENDLRLTSNNGIPQFVTVPDAKDNPKLNISYITIPLSLSVGLSKKTSLKIGGYFGYRVCTVQKFRLKTQNETIHEQRYAGYALNNWLYGADISLDISGFDIIGRYNFSKLFKDNPNYDFSTFMIGTSVSIF